MDPPPDYGLNDFMGLLIAQTLTCLLSSGSESSVSCLPDHIFQILFLGTSTLDCYGVKGQGPISFRAAHQIQAELGLYT